MGDIKIEKSEAFAIRIVNFCNYLVNEKKEYTLSNQVLRSGTSIGANIAESLGAESKEDFIHKLSISQKETYETRFWLTLLFKTNYIDEGQYNSLKKDCDDLLNILTAIIRSQKHKKI